ncbi:MAG: M42 family metallopeptidase [Paracholeplasma sp.]|jgi:glutamyl aminopeptidase|nr:M42 family metallopeptidase [Paracholeplasma sp.]MDY3195613.1 M42 family metallopeptidase [Paracholeplasma sp.]
MKIDPIYEKLMNAFGISAYESDVKSIMLEEIKKYKNYTIEADNLGSVFAVKKSKNPNAKTVMIAGHMDEVGLMVSSIMPNGGLKVIPIGGLVPEVFISQVLHVKGKNGLVPGVIGSIPPHLSKTQKVDFPDFVLDIGATSKEEVKAFGVSIGDMVLNQNIYLETYNKDRIISKAVDNRWGCGMALEVIRDYNDVELDFHLIVGATVQEEVGLRGAGTAVFKFKPDMFIALDASPLNDLLDQGASGKMGEGFLIRLYDPRNIMAPKLFNWFKEVAESNDINYQVYIAKGGTDAARALDSNDGIIATTIGLPARYIHSTAAMFDLKDHFAAYQMVRKVINTLTNEQIAIFQAH